ncbi:hypothetical protein ACJMK2_000549 [Sinanodonta woodiana]|uniref:TIR domain-containing protein n=1 Tax=Sinanodonta woodiana TaxID=1069815 RepID=A0ABD3XPU4_SINWO
MTTSSQSTSEIQSSVVDSDCIEDTLKKTSIAETRNQEGKKALKDCNVILSQESILNGARARPFGICVHKDMLAITDYDELNVQLYRRSDGTLLAKSYELDTRPFNVCFINDEEICATMKYGTIEIMSVRDRHVITRVKQLYVEEIFELCQGIAGFKENIVVSGVNSGTLYWCIVSRNNEPIGNIHTICKGRLSSLTTTENNIYISCDNSHDDPTESGVYGYNIHNPDKPTVLYKHDELNFPKGITVDAAGYVFVCNFSPQCIHHLSEKCELLTIYRHRVPIHQPLYIFWDNEIIYATRLLDAVNSWDNSILRYKPTYSYKQADHNVPELTDKLRQSFIEEPHTETESRRRRGIRVQYCDGDVVYFKPGEFPVKVRVIEDPSLLETITIGSTDQEEYATSGKDDNTNPDKEVIYQRSPQKKTEQQVIDDPTTHKQDHVSEDPNSQTEQLYSADPYAPVEQHVIKDSYTKIEQRIQNIHVGEETCLSTSNQTMPEECQQPVQEKALPPGKKYHAFFSYASPDIQWVKEIVEKLEKDHGFICCEYDRDNTPGTQLLTFADDSIRNAYKTVLVMTREAFQSEFVLLEIQMAISHGFTEKRKCIVPVLVEDCDIPGYLIVFNYVDARDNSKSSIWLPKLLMELES